MDVIFYLHGEFLGFRSSDFIFAPQVMEVCVDAEPKAA